MKKKTNAGMKKLTLNKKIVSNLSNLEMNAVKGGASTMPTESGMTICTGNCGGGTSYWPYATDNQYDCLYKGETSYCCAGPC